MSYRKWAGPAVLMCCLGCSDLESGLSLFGDVELDREFVAGPDGESQPVKDITMALEMVGDGSDGLLLPQDIAFNGTMPDQMWVVSRDNDSATIYSGMDGNTSAENIIDPAASHFMEQVSSIAWGAGNTFATCQDSTNTFNGQAEGNNFMGPALWDADPLVFGLTNPAAVQDLGFDLGSHIDMLHQSPLCMGIAWERDNVYWVFDGFHSSIVRYDFALDHGAGYDDHSDGDVSFWGEGEVERVEGVVSHLDFDHDTGLLYVADTGNNRIAVLDTTSGTRGADRGLTNEPLAAHYTQDNVSFETLVDGDAIGMKQPAGITLFEGLLYVTDAQTGMIHVFDQDGNEIDRARTGRRAGSLAGIYLRAANELYVVDSRRDEVLRLTAEAAADE